MADFSCTISILLYPSLFFLLFYSTFNHFQSRLISFSPHFIETCPNPNVTSSVDPSPFHGFNNVSNTKEELGLAIARSVIKEAISSRTYKSYKKETFIPRGSIYLNPYAFHQSHIEMEKRFKVWKYREGEPPIFNEGPLNSIYAMEGHLIDELGSQRSPFFSSYPEEALAFFLPVSIHHIRQYVYESREYSRERIQKIFKDYVGIISTKYPYWNRSSGVDHFFVSCHDWGPDVSTEDPELYKNFIRVLCNANTTEGFKPSRDVSLPEIFLPYGKLRPPHISRLRYNRTILAFFAGGEHGDVRKALFHHWKEKDKDIQVYGYLKKGMNYIAMMGQSKFCLCPSGHEVASPRIVEAIYEGCIPVIISDNYVLPFSDVLDWTQFSVQIPMSKIPEIKNILQGISLKEYLRFRKNVVQVRRHFEINRPAKPFDVIHMVMHSVWLRRLNVRI